MLRKDGDMTAEAWRLMVARPRSSAGFDALFMAHYAAVFRLLYRITGTREEAEDLAQETFLRLHRSSYLWDGPQGAEQNVRAWLYRVATNLAFNALRSEARRRQREERTAQGSNAHAGPIPDPAELAARLDEQAVVRQALAQMEERQAQLLLLRQAGLSYRELAEALHVAPGSVGTLLARAEAAFESAYSAVVATHEAEGGRDDL